MSLASYRAAPPRVTEKKTTQRAVSLQASIYTYCLTASQARKAADTGGRSRVCVIRLIARSSGAVNVR
jgi:hypothetical protein